MDQYPENWAWISWEARVKARFTCNRCYEVFEGGNRYLIGVHHKDYDKKNNNPLNLEVLCWPCHRDIHLLNDPLFYQGEEPEDYWRMGLTKTVKIKEVVDDVLRKYLKIQRINLEEVRR